MLYIIGLLVLGACGIDLLIAFLWVGLITYDELISKYKEVFPKSGKGNISKSDR